MWGQASKHKHPVERLLSQVSLKIDRLGVTSAQVHYHDEASICFPPTIRPFFSASLTNTLHYVKFKHLGRNWWWVAFSEWKQNGLMHFDIWPYLSHLLGFCGHQHCVGHTCKPTLVCKFYTKLCIKPLLLNFYVKHGQTMAWYMWLTLID